MKRVPLLKGSRREQLESAAYKFHSVHPVVWVLFLRFTRNRIAKGFKHYSARAIFHRIRWETSFPTYEPGKDFKLNNNHSPFYARWFHETCPEHDGFFRTRHQDGEGEDE